MKVFVLINSNNEGYNFLGVFDSREKAEEAGNLYRIRRDARTRDIFSGSGTKELEEALRFDRSWYGHIIHEYEMNDLVGQ